MYIHSLTTIVIGMPERKSIFIQCSMAVKHECVGERFQFQWYIIFYIAGPSLIYRVEGTVIQQWFDIFLQAILDVVVNMQFQMVENLWHHFWADPKSSM